MTRVLHPILFAVYPFLFLYASNVEEWAIIAPERMVGPMVITLVFSLALFEFLRLRWENAHKAGHVVSWLLILFFSYGHVRSALGPGLERVVPHAVQLGLWIALFAGGVWLVRRARGTLRDATRIANVVSVALVAMPLVTLGAFAVTGLGVEASATTAALGDPPTLVMPADPPNLYYIIPDEYANAHVLEETYDFDNSPFLDALRARGFGVAERSAGGYGMTYLSLASALNLGYLEDLAEEGHYAGTSFAPVTRLIQENLVATLLKEQGYRYVVFRSGWAPTSESPLADEVVPCGRDVSEYERVLGRSTVLEAAWDQTKGNGKRARLACAFDHLARLPHRGEEPFFALVHLVAPHPPWVHDAEGNAVYVDDGPGLGTDEEEAKRAYVAQLQWLNARLLEALDAIVAQDPDAVIVLQSDTGPTRLLGSYASEPSDEAIRERMRVLNAIRLGRQGGDAVPHDLSPVNAWRLVLGERFGAEMEMLPTRSFFSTYDEPFGLRDVTDIAGFPRP